MRPFESRHPAVLLSLLLALTPLTHAADLSTEVRALKDKVSQFAGFSNLSSCGRCYVVKTEGCSATQDVVAYSRCETAGCLCNEAKRKDYTEHILNRAESGCSRIGDDDVITPKQCVDFFNNFCEAQPASAAEEPSSSDADSPSGSSEDEDPPKSGGGQSIEGDGNSITNTDDKSVQGNNCGTGDNNNGSIVCQGGGADELALGLGLGFGVPTVLIAILTLCAYDFPVAQKSDFLRLNC